MTDTPGGSPRPPQADQAWAKRVLVALGGNAMSAPDGSATEPHQIAALTAAAGHIADLVAAGFEVAVTHGNGPQVGNLLVKNELSAHVVPPVSLDWCVASTQATIGFVLADALDTALAERNASRPVAALVTRCLVDADDPAFQNPIKPVGRYLPADQAQPFIEMGQHWADYGDRGFRRVVPSPRPVEVLDAAVGRGLMQTGAVVVMNGGGGIPVVRTDAGLQGVEAVIDKDLGAALLARYLSCDTLVIATDIANAVLGYGTSDARPVGHVSADEMRTHVAAGHFAAGSMGPKVEAALDFGSGPNQTSVITTLDRLANALTAPRGTIGTVITTDGP